MAKVSNKQKVKIRLAAVGVDVADYFKLLPELLDNISSPEPALAYAFQRVEAAQRMGLYALVMREYRTNQRLTWEAIDALQINRKEFAGHFARIAGKELPNSLGEKIKPAERTRDAIMHGRTKRPSEVHSAIISCLDYAEELNNQFWDKAGFKPVGQLRGVTGKKGKPQLDTKVSKAVIAGLRLGQI